MSLLTAGFWPTTFFPSSYWPEDFWQDYGLPISADVRKIFKLVERTHKFTVFGYVKIFIIRGRLIDYTILKRTKEYILYH